MKEKIKITLIALGLCCISMLSYAQNQDPLTPKPPATQEGDTEDNDDENLFDISTMKNPYEEMMETSVTNSFTAGFADVGNLEKAMMAAGGAVETGSNTSKAPIKYDVQLDENIDIHRYEYVGVWKIAYKEKFEENRIVPFHRNYDLNNCLNDTIIITNRYLYGATTCINNLLFFDNPQLLKERYFLLGSLHPEALAKKTSKSSQKNVPLITDTSGTNNQSFLAAMYERFGVDEINGFRSSASKRKQKIAVRFFLINQNLMAYFYNSTIYYLERIDQTVKKVNSDLPIDANYKSIDWKKDANGYNFITGKDMNDFNLFIEEDLALSIKNSEATKPKKAKLHITFYPPIVGQNNLAIFNVALDPKTGNSFDEVEVFNSNGTINSVQQIYIPMDKIGSPLFTINFVSDESKKYSWGMKYKIIYR